MMMDLCSSLLMETKLRQKKSSFPAEMPLMKLMGAVNLQSPVIARKFPQEHQIRMRFDKRWPVSHDHITGSSVQLIEVICFFPQSLPIPQTTLDSFIQNYSLVSTLYRVGKGELQDIFKKVALFCEGNQEVQKLYDCCITVLRTFV